MCNKYRIYKYMVVGSRVCKVFIFLWWTHLHVDVVAVPARYVLNLYRTVWCVVLCCVVLAKAYSGLGSLASALRSINFVVVVLVYRKIPSSSLYVLFRMLVCFYVSYMFAVPYFYWSSSLTNIWFNTCFALYSINSASVHFVLWRWRHLQITMQNM